MLKCKARLKANLKVCVCYLVMSPFSRDYMSNVLPDLHVYRIHTVPGFLDGRTSILVQIEYIKDCFRIYIF